MEININSGQIEIIGHYGTVFLYTNKEAYNLTNVVLNVLSEKVHWDDPDYLTRVLFCNMVPKDQWYNTNGFGIGTQMYIDVKLLITLDIVHQKITLMDFDKYHKYVKNIYTFEEFVTKFENNAEL